MNLAKQNADKPEDDDDLRKKLWLKIGVLMQCMNYVNALLECYETFKGKYFNIKWYGDESICKICHDLAK